MDEPLGATGYLYRVGLPDAYAEVAARIKNCANGCELSISLELAGLRHAT